MEKNKFGEDAARSITVSYYVAECMEFIRYGEYMEGIQSIKEAVKRYEEIPSERLNAVKGIGVQILDPEEQEYPQSYPLVTGHCLDVDMLKLMYGYERYPQILVAAREVVSFMPELDILDSEGVLKERTKGSKTVDTDVLAERINRFQKELDPDFYLSFYADEYRHQAKIAMQLLVVDERQNYRDWIKLCISSQKGRLQAEAGEILEMLDGQVAIPHHVEPFVYIEFTEDTNLEDGEILSIEDAVPLFGELDYKQKKAKKEGKESVSNKVWFRIGYLNGGELAFYHGCQDLGDGDGNLFQHMEKHCSFYLESLTQKDDTSVKESCLFVKNELLPRLKYCCNLSRIETALANEQRVDIEAPLESKQHVARCQYQKDMAAFIRNSREALDYGGELPEMPDIKDYERTGGRIQQQREDIHESELSGDGSQIEAGCTKDINRENFKKR